MIADASGRSGHGKLRCAILRNDLQYCFSYAFADLGRAPEEYLVADLSIHLQTSTVSA
jgi:hypothetical protein